MAKLKDYLGILVKEINQARVMADVESAKIAQVYAQDHILKNFSIPRFRTKDIELTIPVAIDKLKDEVDDGYEPIDDILFKKEAYRIAKDVAKVKVFNKNVSTDLRDKISVQVDEFQRELKGGEVDENGIDSFFMKMSDFFVEMYQYVLGKEFNELLFSYKFKTTRQLMIYTKEKLEEALRDKIKKRQNKSEIANAEIIAEAHRLKEIKQECIIQIKMKLLEEGMEWHIIESPEGEKTLKLLPE